MEQGSEEESKEDKLKDVGGDQAEDKVTDSDNAEVYVVNDEHDPMTIPYEPSSEDDDDSDLDFPDDPLYIDSGWASECLQDPEDIDFEFVYALHTFVATVEGQANATKGDTMVLLDDSNSYWWLVRVVKDSSIGRAKPMEVLRVAEELTGDRLPTG